MTRTFYEMPTFTKQWKELGLDEDDLISLQNIILSDPEVGVIIRGTGGVRKMRFAYIGRGKSGSTRIIYVDFALYESVYLISAYQKSDKESLTDAEKKELKELVRQLKTLERRKR